MSNDIKLIIGSWELVHYIAIDIDGNRSHQFGEDAIGFLIYDKNGNMSVQISKHNRTPFQTPIFYHSTSEELTTLPKEYLAYFGRYDIDEENKIMRHLPHGHLFPNCIGKNLERRYELWDGMMSLKPLEGPSREILWKKFK